MIYLDNAATTKIRAEVLEEIKTAMEKNYANADSSHEMGVKVADEIKSRKKIFKKIFSLPEENFYFTSGGSDGNNLLIQGIVRSKKTGHIITTKIEHPSVSELISSLSEENYDVSYLDVDSNGRISLDQLRDEIRDDTILVSIIGVNSEIGIIQDLASISKVIKDKNSKTYFHTDFVQGLGHANIDFSKFNIDAITISAHKIYGPKGVGAIYLKKGTSYKNIIHGSNSSNGIIKRTMQSELIFGFLKALEIMHENFSKDISHLKEIKSYFISKLKSIDDIRINSLEDESLASPAILNVSFRGIRGEVLMNFLSMHEIFVSTGSACSSKKGNSRILKNIGLSEDEIEGGIRFSFSIYNTFEEIDYTIKVLEESLAQIRMLK